MERIGMLGMFFWLCLFVVGCGLTESEKDKKIKELEQDKKLLQAQSDPKMVLDPNVKPGDDSSTTAEKKEKGKENPTPAVCPGDNCAKCPAGEYWSKKANEGKGGCCDIPLCDGGRAFDMEAEVCDCLAGDEWSPKFKKCVPDCNDYTEVLSPDGEECLKKKTKSPSTTTTTGTVTTEPEKPKPPDDTYLKKKGVCNEAAMSCEEI